MASKKKVPPTEGLVLVRYGTHDSSWISAYASRDVAKKHIVENALIHFADRELEVDDDDEGGVPAPEAMEADIKLKIDQKEEIIEFDDWSAEIEYNEFIKFE